MFPLLARTTPSLAVMDGDIRYYVSTNDWLGRATYSSRQFSADVLGEAIAIIRTRHGSDPVAGRTFVDAGANIGTTTLPALRRFGAAHAVAIEPDTDNHRLLRCNLVANDLLENATTPRVALSNTTGTAVLERSLSNTGDHRLRLPAVHNGAFDEASRPTVFVPVTRLDDLLTEANIPYTEVGLVWMDIQGHEAMALDGAPRLLASPTPVVIEYWPYGLRRTGSLDHLHTIISDSYPVVIDLRASMTARRPLELNPQDVLSLPDRYSRRPTSHTDLLLLKR